MFLCSWFWRTVGVSLFWGLFWLVRRVFSGSGFFWFLASSCLLAVWSWGVGAGCRGFSRVRGWVRLVLAPCGGGGRVRLARPAPAFLCGGWVRVCAWFLLPVGVGVGCVCASGSFLGCGFRGWVGRPGSFLGVGCAWFPGSCSRWFLVVFAGGFRVFLFPLGASLLWFGGCRVGLGFVSPAVLLGPGSGWFLVGGWPGFGFGFGFVWRV